MITRDPLNPNKQNLVTPFGTASIERKRRGWHKASDRVTVIDGKTYKGPDPMLQHFTIKL